MRRLRRLLLAFAVVVAGSLVGLAPAATTAGAAPCATGDLHVAMVVDFGDAVTVTSTCVAVDNGATGADALSARADALGTAQPQFEGGLVCAIDGYPDLRTTPCAAQNPDGTYAYWSYWHGSNGQWKYSSVGANYRVQADVVEGWRYLPNGKDTGALPQPRGSAMASTICAPAPATSTDAPTAAAPAPGDDPGAVTASSAPAAAVGAGPTSTSSAPDSTTTSSPSASTRSGSSNEAAARPVVTIAAGGSRGGGSPLGLVVGALLIGALAAGGVIAVRRRSAPEP